MTYQQLQFQGLPFRPDDKQVFYIEGTHDLQYNGLLELEYRRISDAFQRHCLQFCYLPKLFRTAGVNKRYAITLLICRRTLPYLFCQKQLC